MLGIYTMEQIKMTWEKRRGHQTCGKEQGRAVCAHALHAACKPDLQRKVVGANGVKTSRMFTPCKRISQDQRLDHLPQRARGDAHAKKNGLAWVHQNHNDPSAHQKEALQLQP